ncbi:phenazine biosynthesis protein PhzF [Comamonas serinivorans]|uniref:Phenazine biosynthesis protein PhzF n=1 Tax=Comamonas serinivorans TaxID=1082851 RepID=A0A1Y0EK94_9BURK|nr:phenazine biosynthesis protein PhzF [Comamonas serinivorans]
MTIKQRAFAQVDVFSSRLGDGNPVAVVLDADGMSEADMARLAVWTNLSETTFVLPPTQPGADYRLRIFTPAGELPFAGHPTLGSCFAWLAAGGRPQQATHIVQECAKGLIALRPEGDGLAFATPALDRRDLSAAELAELLAALQLPPEAVLASQRLDNGPVWWTLLLDSAERLLSLPIDANAVLRLGRHIGLAARTDEDATQDLSSPGLIRRASREARAFASSQPATAEAVDLEVRALFCAPHQLFEDPVTGSLNGSLAQWLIAEGRMPARYTAAQGTAIGRAGRVQLSHTDDQVWVGGRCVAAVTGQILA